LVLTEEETDQLPSRPNQRYFGPHRDYLHMRLMIKSGLRASEAVSLRPEHLGFMSGKLMVREGKGAFGRTLWIGEEMLSEPQDWIDHRQETAGDPKYLLPTLKGTKVATSHLRRSTGRYARDADIEMQTLKRSSGSPRTPFGIPSPRASTDRRARSARQGRRSGTRT
jgi:integrase/recombinase XerD